MAWGRNVGSLKSNTNPFYTLDTHLLLNKRTKGTKVTIGNKVECDPSNVIAIFSCPWRHKVYTQQEAKMWMANDTWENKIVFQLEDNGRLCRDLRILYLFSKRKTRLVNSLGKGVVVFPSVLALVLWPNIFLNAYLMQSHLT